MGCVGQWTAKSLTVKFGGIKEKSATLAITAEMSASTSAQVRVRPGSKYSQSLMDSNSAAL